MGQQEIYDFLKKNKTKWFTTKSLSNQLNTSVGSITSCVKKMRISSSVDFKHNSEGRLGFLYRFRR